MTGKHRPQTVPEEGMEITDTRRSPGRRERRRADRHDPTRPLTGKAFQKERHRLRCKIRHGQPLKVFVVRAPFTRTQHHYYRFLFQLRNTEKRSHYIYDATAVLAQLVGEKVIPQGWMEVSGMQGHFNLIQFFKDASRRLTEGKNCDALKPTKLPGMVT